MCKRQANEIPWTNIRAKGATTKNDRIDYIAQIAKNKDEWEFITIKL